MGMMTVEQLDQTVNFEQISAWRTIKGAVLDTPFGRALVHEFEGACDHETCYETHPTFVVFAINGRYFKKTGTYDSQDGLVWSGHLQEVKPVEKTVQVWDPVPVVVWDAAGISTFLREWMKTQAGTRYSGYDWPSLYYQAEDGLEIPGFPYTITGVEEYAPGEPESNGPVWLIFEINGDKYAAKGRNVSHCGWDFDGVYALEKVEKKTVTREVWS